MSDQSETKIARPVYYQFGALPMFGGGIAGVLIGTLGLAVKAASGEITPTVTLLDTLMVLALGSGLMLTGTCMVLTGVWYGRRWLRNHV